MSTAATPGPAVPAPTGSAHPGGVRRLWDRQLHAYPDNGPRFASLGIVVLTTVVLYYQLYLVGGVATDVLRDLDMSFVYFVNISVVGYALGALASVVAGLADRYGRANIVTAGLLVTGVLCTFVLPQMSSKAGFAVVYIVIGFVEGIVLVATPALIRDFSPQLGRASAMGYWTVGPVAGSLVVSAVVSASSATSSWQHQYTVAGVVGLIVFVVAALGLRELSPRLRDQLMVSSKDRALVEARAKGIDLGDALKRPFRQMLHLDIVGSAFAISVFLIFYYVAVGFFPVFFETVFGYSQSKANALGNWFWSINIVALLVVGYISDLVRVRKPFMVAGALGAAVFTAIFAVKATDASTSYTGQVILLVLISIFQGMAFAPWMASFTETVERRNPALTATGLALWGLIIRIVIAIVIFFVPKVIDTTTPLVQQGPAVQEALADPTPVSTAAGPTTVGAVATSVSEHPDVVAQLQAAQASGQQPTPAQAAAAAQALGSPAILAALAQPTPPLAGALRTLSQDGPVVAAAAERSPDQWRTYFLIGVAGQLVFIPLTFLMAGYWDPKKARAAEREHEAMVAAELERLRAPAAGPALA